MKFLKTNKKVIIVFMLVLAVITFISFADFTPDETKLVNNVENKDSVIEKIRSDNVVTENKSTTVNASNQQHENSSRETPADKDAEKQVIPQNKEALQTNKDLQNEKALQDNNCLQNEEILQDNNGLQNKEKKNDKLTCTLTIKCDTILKNLSSLNPQKADIVPPSGIILIKKEVEFFENESVFNVLLRETKKNKIHFEFSKTPGLGSVYIEGIANIYEFDCGDLSGWMYCVNKSFPNYSCSEYKLKNGDNIEFIYTCASGKDIK